MTADETSTGDAAGGSEEPRLVVKLDWRDESAVLAVIGEIDMVRAPQFQKELLAVLEQQPSRLVVDLTEVGFFASAGLSALVVAYQQAGEHTEVRVVAANTATARPLQVTGLDRKISIYSSQEQALAEP